MAFLQSIWLCLLPALLHSPIRNRTPFASNHSMNNDEKSPPLKSQTGVFGQDASAHNSTGGVFQPWEDGKVAKRLLLQNDYSELKTIAKAMDELMQKNSWSKDFISILHLAVEEWAVNVITYAYDCSQTCSFEVLCWQDDDYVKVCIKDSGEVFNPTKMEMPNLDTTLEERQIGGLGIHLIRQSVDIFEYSRVAGNNLVTLGLKIPTT